MYLVQTGLPENSTSFSRVCHSGGVGGSQFSMCCEPRAGEGVGAVVEGHMQIVEPADDDF